MEIKTAKTAGFCFGVRRAVDLVYDNITEKPLYTYGPIIHNDTVVWELKNKGVTQLDSLEDIQNAAPGTVIIRAHGIPEEMYEMIRGAGHRIIDATCPFVLKIHKIVKNAVSEGNYVIIIGDPGHPEIQGIRSCGGDSCTVINSEMEALSFIPDEKYKDKRIIIVAQTTYNFRKFQDIVEILNKTSYSNVDVLNTICSATQERQTEAKELSQEMDAMLVIGDRNSSNSQKLFAICKENCQHTFFIQRADDFDYSSLKGFYHIGITAGASTPNIIIEEVQRNCQISILNRH